MRFVCRALLSAVSFIAAAEPPNLPLPPPEHPRLYLRARDLPDVRRRMTHPATAPAWQKLQMMAGQKTQIRLEVDALRYLVDRNPALARRTVADTIKLLNSVNPGQFSDSRKPGRLMVTAAIVYDWCYPIVTTEQKVELIKIMIRLAQSLECGYPPDKGSFVIGHPSEFMILRDMLSAGVAMYDENPEMYRFAAGRILGTHVPARNWWYPGGAFHQGPGYADARFVSDMYAAWIFARMGAGSIFDPSQRFVPYEWIYLRRPDGKFIRAGDGQNWPTQLGSLLAASYYHDGYILADWMKDPVIDPTNKLYDFLWPEKGTGPMSGTDSEIFEFLWRDPDLQPSPISELPLSRYYGFPYGWMTARTGWDENSVIAQMRVNIYNFGGHQHADGGSFELYYKGPLAVHSGVYQGVNGGYGSPHHRNYYQRTIAHNSLLIFDPDEQFGNARQPLVNDGGQRIRLKEPLVLGDLLRPEYETGDVLAHEFGPDSRRPAYTYLEGDITKAYTAKVREVTRSQVFLNFAGSAAGGGVPAALVVFDRVVAANPAFQKFWLLQSVAEPAIDGTSQIVSLSQNGWSGKLWNTTLLPAPDNARIEKVGGSGKEFWVFGKNFPNSTVPPDPEAGGWRIEISPKTPAAADLFLNVIQVMDRSLTKPLPVERIVNGNVVGARIGDRVVLFQTARGRAQNPVDFRVTVASHVLVTGLGSGSWRLTRDGKSVETFHASDAGTVYVEVSAGAYELVRS